MKKKILAIIAGALSMLCLACSVAATSLDDIGGDNSSSGGSSISAPPSGGNADYDAGDAYSELGMTGEDLEQATKIISPVVKWVNIGIGVVVALLGTFLLGVTVLDLLYIVSPQAIRNIGGGAQPAGGGMPGMGMGMGMGMGGGAPQPQAASGFSALISDDCKAALAECGAAAGGAQMGGGMPGMGMGGGFGGGGFGGGFGGMGGGMMGGMGGAAPVKPKTKTVALTYLKKRVFTLILIGVCAVILTCTVFLDVGTAIGQWIVNLIGNIT